MPQERNSDRMLEQFAGRSVCQSGEEIVSVSRKNGAGRPARHQGGDHGASRGDVGAGACANF